MISLSGTQIIQRLQQNDTSVFLEVQHHFLPAIKGMLVNKGLAPYLLEQRSQEVFQQTIFEIWRLIHATESYQEDGKFNAFFMSIAMKVSANIYRSHKKHHPYSISYKASNEVDGNLLSYPIGLPDLASLPDDRQLEATLFQTYFLIPQAFSIDFALAKIDPHIMEMEQIKKHQLIEQNFPKLSAKEQQVMRLYWREQLRVAEIATYLGQSQPNIKTILYRAKQKLRKWCVES